MGQASPGSSAPFLEARSIELWRGERHLLRGVSFSLQPGESLQLVGPNGVGKSSLLRVITGLLPSESGEVLWRGRNTLRVRPEFQSQLAYLAHANALKQDLTALENLAFGSGLRRRASRIECTAALDRVGLSHCSHIPSRALSAGQRRRLALARVLLSEAALWILDEPATNLDADGSRAVAALMQEHLQKQGAILCAAHYALLPEHPRARILELS